MSSDGKPFGGTSESLSPMGGLQGRSSEDSQLSHMPEIVRQPPLFEQDYARVHRLMQDKELTMSYFKPLEQELSQGKRLKHALYESEQKHGFSKDVQRISGSLLSQGEFMGMLKEGRSFKDRSAAADHGEYTHRLQWYAVSRDMEANPHFYTAKSSSDLYRGLAERYERGQTAKYNWKSLFDENASTGDYRQPENLTKDLKANDTLSNLQHAMTGEFQKRGALSKFGAMQQYKKGPERNARIELMRSIGLWTDKKADAYLTPEDYQPPKRTQGQQPPTKQIDTPTLVKGSKV